MPQTSSLLRRAVAALAATAVLLAAPAPAPAAEQVGSDLAGAPVAQACAAPCTVTLHQHGFFATDLPIGSVVTGFGAHLSPSARVRPRLLRRDGDGVFTAVAEGAEVRGDAGGGVQRFPTHLVVGQQSATLGLEVLEGAVEVAADPYDVLAYGTYAPPLGAGETRAAAVATGDLLLAATAEPDWDEDGLGDESEDGCVRCDPGDGGAGGGGGDAGGGGGDDAGGGGGGPALRFTIDARSILRAGEAGRKGYIEVYAVNDGRVDVTGTLQVKLGRRVLGTGSIDLEWGEQYGWGLFRLPPAARAKLLRTGRLGVVATARVRAADGRTRTFTRRVTIHRGGASGYDGTYRGPGPVTIVVERGMLVSISTSLMLYCPKLNVMRTVAFLPLSGFPTLIRRDGSFSAKGSDSGDTKRYHGRLRRRGASRGYLSLFHTELWVDGGGLRSDTCFQARNWTVRRVG